MTYGKTLIKICIRCKRVQLIYAKGLCGTCYNTLLRNPSAKLKINRKLEKFVSAEKGEQ